MNSLLLLSLAILGACGSFDDPTIGKDLRFLGAIAEPAPTNLIKPQTHRLLSFMLDVANISQTDWVDGRVINEAPVRHWYPS